jgi:hypothetical protein
MSKKGNKFLNRVKNMMMTTTNHRPMPWFLIMRYLLGHLPTRTYFNIVFFTSAERPRTFFQSLRQNDTAYIDYTLQTGLTFLAPPTYLDHASQNGPQHFSGHSDDLFFGHALQNRQHFCLTFAERHIACKSAIFATLLSSSIEYSLSFYFSLSFTGILFAGEC